MKNIYQQNNNIESYPRLATDIECDIAIIGGGISGILTAYKLSERGKKVCVFEKRKIGSGNTAFSTGNISAVQEFLYQDIDTKYSFEQAKLYYHSQAKAILAFQNIVQKHNISCDFHIIPSVLYTYNDFDKLAKEKQLLLSFGASVTDVDGIEYFKRQGAGISVDNQAIINPLAFVQNLPKEFDIYEDTAIIGWDFDKHLLYTSDHVITCKKIIFATQFPLPRLTGGFALKMYKSNSYVIALKNTPKLPYAFNDNLENGLFFRNFGEYLLLCGIDHRTGRAPKYSVYDKLECLARELFPTCEVANKWCYNDCVTFDGIPFACNISPKLKDVFVISGFNKWGLASAMACSDIVTDLICDTPNKYASLYSPSRGYSKANNGDIFKNGLLNSGYIAKTLFHIPLKSYKKLGFDSAVIALVNGKKRGVYKDKNGIFHIISAICPHLGCELSWNADDRTWDCPCHGSRFDIDGHIITAPAITRRPKKIKI